jgi:hypothetical protein
MIDERVSVHWFIDDAVGLPARQTKSSHRQSRIFPNLQSAVKFVMEDLEESRRPNAQIAIPGGTMSFAIIKRMYAQKREDQTPGNE